MQFAVASHVFLCVAGDYVVLLDLRRDRYWALEAVRTRGLGRIIRGWPVSAPDQIPNAAAHGDMAGVRLLAEQGLLCADGDPGKDATPVALAPLARHLPPDETGSRLRIDARSVPSVLLAVASAAVRIRRSALDQLVISARRRKQARAECMQSFDMERAERLVATFARLRPMLFSAREACLFSSLALLELFARHDLFPLWVFGVQTRPFAAHCWVQQDGVLFSDTVERVSRYTPIMVV